MEVYQTDNHYILLEGEYSLWCSRKHGTLEPKTGNDLCSAWNPVCIGLVYGLIGKIKIHPDSDWKLLLITRQTNVGRIGEANDVYQINKVIVLSLSDAEPQEMELDLCAKHHFGIRRTDRITQNTDDQGMSLQKTWNTLKSAAENVKPRKRDIKDKEKFEKRILEELIKMYNETNSFYYCKTYDLTNTVQRQYQKAYDQGEQLWKRSDARFFWNMHMVKELTEMQTELASHWILPLVQGHVDIQTCLLDFGDTMSDLSPMRFSSSKQTNKTKDPLTYKLILLSRRSRHRAGTRSKKRGLDETGACANYVETEQMIEFSHHRVSFVQVRGSIPVFWSQTGVKYRPPPKLDKGLRLNQAVDHEVQGSCVDSSKFGDLPGKMADFLVLAKSDSTNVKYLGYYKKWEQFISGKGESALPASPIHVALYLTELMDKRTSNSIVQSTAYSIKWAHSLRNLPDPTNNSFVKNLLEASKRVLSKPVCKKEPISTDVLIELCNKYEGSTDVLIIRDLCMILIAFAGFLRFDELVHLHCNDVMFFHEYLSLHIRQSKTDQYRKGDEVVISRGTTKACPYSMLRRYLEVTKLNTQENVFLFRPCYRSKYTCGLIHKNKALSYTRSRETVVSRLREVVGDLNIGLHSLRAGGASKAANAGVNDRCWKRHGRWKGENSKDGYVAESLERILSVSRSLEL